MARAIYYLFVIVATLWSVDAKNLFATKTCSLLNEVYSTCGNNNCQNTCANPTASVGCTGACVAGCICAAGFVRNSLNVCVLQALCSPATAVCGTNEVLSACGNDGCQRSCTRLTVTNCVTVCSTPACICITGFVRNGAGACILPSACPTTTCPTSEYYSTCGDDGCQLSCTRPTINGCVSVCSGPKCICVPGTVRGPLGTCISPSTCPMPPTCSGAGETYTSTLNNACQQTCSFTPPAMCSAPNAPGCICTPPLLRNYLGNCVPLASCSLCPTGEIFRSCGPLVCENDCANQALTSMGALCTTANACISKCFCPSGFFRNSNGVCVVVGTPCT